MWQAAILIAPLALIEQLFFAANAIKIIEGGWLPLLMAGIIALLIANLVAWLENPRQGKPATLKPISNGWSANSRRSRPIAYPELPCS